MKIQELSDLAVAEGAKQARQVFEKRGEQGYQTVVRLREDELAALLARAFQRGADQLPGDEHANADA